MRPMPNADAIRIIAQTWINRDDEKEMVLRSTDTDGERIMRTYPFLHCMICTRAHTDQSSGDTPRASIACPVRKSQGLWGWPCHPDQSDTMPPAKELEVSHANTST